MSLAARAWWVAKRDADAIAEELDAERGKRFSRPGRLRHLEATLERAREIEQTCLRTLGAPSVRR